MEGVLIMINLLKIESEIYLEYISHILPSNVRYEYPDNFKKEKNRHT